MHLEDEEKTSFITPFGMYYYNMVPFGLNNMGDNYQRVMHVTFNDQISKNMELYINDLILNLKMI